jgi:hypothetical protein
MLAPLEGTSDEHKAGAKIFRNAELVFQFSTAMRFTDETLIQILEAMRTPGGRKLPHTRLVLERTTQVHNALHAARVLNSLPQHLVAAMIHHWVVDAELPLMMEPTLAKVIVNHWCKAVRLWMDPPTQQQYFDCLEQHGRQAAHQFMKRRFHRYLWLHRIPASQNPFTQ